MGQQSIEIQKGGDVISIRMQLRGRVNKEKDGMYVSYCPALDLYSQGETAKEARDMLADTVRVFIEACLEDGTLKEILHDCGFYLAGEKARKKQPSPVVSGGRMVKIPAEIPFWAAA